jgi:hypothetical protein
MSRSEASYAAIPPVHADRLYYQSESVPIAKGSCEHGGTHPVRLATFFAPPSGKTPEIVQIIFPRLIASV